MFAEPEFWVAVAFVILMGVFAYFGIHRTVLTTLDHRRDRIKAELDDALRLRREAEGVLAEYRRKQSEAETVAESIILNARGEAERMAEEAKARVEEFIARRTKMAETRIAQAEAQALADVRSAAADAAIAAAETILVKTTRGPTAEALVTQSISDLKTKLN